MARLLLCRPDWREESFRINVPTGNRQWTLEPETLPRVVRILTILPQSDGVEKNFCQRTLNTIGGRKEDLQTLRPCTIRVPLIYCRGVIFGVHLRDCSKGLWWSIHDNVKRWPSYFVWDTWGNPLLNLQTDQRRPESGTRKKEVIKTKHRKVILFRIDTFTDVRFRRLRRNI